MVALVGAVCTDFAEGWAVCVVGRHIKPKTKRVRFLEFCRCLRSLCPPEVRVVIVPDAFSPHLTSKKDTRVGDWAAAGSVEFGCTPTDSSWLNRIEAQSTAPGYFAWTAPTTPATRDRAA
ncbi:hypothetical protein [Streptomyces viridochromogenes]|uniref:hypothetical protein n=1 Tax=Streptomyces viridochromogenes TaxID=1938 RepID=UPI0018FEF078|nr:hypothetical protein [Streptomyces viridochromogenes]